MLCIYTTKLERILAKISDFDEPAASRRKAAACLAEKTFRFGQPRGAPARAERQGFIRAKSMGGSASRPRSGFRKAV